MAGQPHAGQRGAGTAAGRYPRPVRPVRGHRAAFGPVWLGRVRLLPQPFPLVLGIQADADLHLRGDGDRVRPGQPEAGRRARPGLRHAPRPACQPPGTGHRGRHRQGPGRRGHRSVLHQPRPGPDPDPPRPQGRTAPVFPQLAAPAHRGHHLDTEEPARPRTPRWPRPGRAVGPHRPAAAALNAAIWFNWQIGAPVKRSLIAYDH